MKFCTLRLTCTFLFLITGISAALAQTTTFKMDTSMSMESFGKNALLAKDSVWVVDFWATWCGPCVKSLPHLKEVVEDYKSSKVKFISVSHDRTEQAWIDGVYKFGLNWTHLLLRQSTPIPAVMNKEMNHPFIPSIFVVDKKGKVMKVPSPDGVAEYIEKALKTGF